ncbi:MAG: hypothetical protein ACRC4T_21040 [Cetobacterium sp.]
MKRSCCDDECDYVCRWFDLEASYCVLNGSLTEKEVEEGCGSFDDYMGKK